MISFTVLSLVLCFLSGCLSKNSNMCFQVKAKLPFSAKEIENKWYAQEITGVYSEKAVDCLFLNYENDRMTIQNGNKTLVLDIEQHNKTSRFRLQYKNRKVSMVILNKDIKDYALAYFCVKKRGTAVILTKEQQPKPEVIEKARKHLKRQRFTVEDGTMKIINQAECK